MRVQNETENSRIDSKVIAYKTLLIKRICSKNTRKPILHQTSSICGSARMSVRSGVRSICRRKNCLRWFLRRKSTFRVSKRAARTQVWRHACELQMHFTFPSTRCWKALSKREARCWNQIRRNRICWTTWYGRFIAIWKIGKLRFRHMQKLRCSKQRIGIFAAYKSR